MLPWLYLSMSLLTLLWVVLWLWAGRIPREHQAIASRHFDQPVEAVWQTLTNFAAYPAWLPELTQTQELEPGLWEEQYQRRSLRLKTLVLAPPHQLVRAMEPGRLPFGGQWDYQLAPEAGGCRLTITEQGWIDDRLFRLLAQVFMGYESSLQEFLTHLDQALNNPSPP